LQASDLLRWRREGGSGSLAQFAGHDRSGGLQVRVNEIAAGDVSLWAARGVALLAGLAACVWQWAFWIFITVYALGFAAYSMQRRFLFEPARGSYKTPSESNLEGVYEHWLNSEDGEQLLTWQARPQPGMPTILYFHGNNCNLTNRRERVKRFVRDGYGLLMLSFRGYGLSSGRPSEKNNVADAFMAYDFLRRRNVSPQDIIVYGESLGSGVAVQLAARRPIAALVLEAPYTSLADLVRHRIRAIPAYLFLKDEFNSVEHIKAVSAPLLIIHSLGDEIIPIAYGRRLFDAADGQKEFVRVRGAGHHGLFRAGAWPRIRAFAEKYVRGAGMFGDRARRNVEMARKRAERRSKADDMKRGSLAGGGERTGRGEGGSPDGSPLEPFGA
jgi:pimeloyl-ACP methyl ester carboxylesterase